MWHTDIELVHSLRTLEVIHWLINANLTSLISNKTCFGRLIFQWRILPCISFNHENCLRNFIAFFHVFLNRLFLITSVLAFLFNLGIARRLRVYLRYVHLNLILNEVLMQGFVSKKPKGGVLLSNKLIISQIFIGGWVWFGDRQYFKRIIHIGNV